MHPLCETSLDLVTDKHTSRQLPDLNTLLLVTRGFRPDSYDLLVVDILRNGRTTIELTGSERVHGCTIFALAAKLSHKIHDRHIEPAGLRLDEDDNFVNTTYRQAAYVEQSKV